MSTDSLLWQPIGEILLTTDWQIIDTEINGQTFRFTYSVDWNIWNTEFDRRAFAIARFYYSVDGDSLVSPSFRLYPKATKEIRDLPIPKGFNDRGLLTRSLGVKGIRLSRYAVFNQIPIIPWQLQIDYLF